MNEWRVFVGLRRMRIGSVPSLSTDLVNRFPLPFSWYWGLSLGPHMLGKVSVTSHQVSSWKASVLPQSVPEGASGPAPRDSQISLCIINSLV